MPYTEAFMLETHRTVNILANLVPRRAKTDVIFGDYIIPEVSAKQLNLNKYVNVFH